MRSGPLAATGLIVGMLLCAAAQAALVGRSTATNGNLEYVGFGDVGGGVGSGRYTLGTCSQAGGTTTCTLSGTYVETTQSDHAPVASGTFTLQLAYPGTSTSPVVAGSIAPGSDVLQFISTGDGVFTLHVFPTTGGQFTAVYPAAVFADSLVFSAFLDPATVACINVPAGRQCRVGDVGLVPGATITGAVNPLDFTIPGNFSLGTPVDVVEYYNAVLDHYFITWLPAEMANLDAGRTPTRWNRTGYTFKMYNTPATGLSPVCRFYIPPGKGDSHFFGRGTTECNATGVAHPDFVNEEPNFMFTFLPAAGTCPANTRPVYRVFSNRPDANHRYMIDTAVRDQMVARGWLPEGDGPDLVVMCAPL